MNASQPLPRIFVQIASYRDEECQWTVKDLFEKAKHPERIFIGICWQYDPEEDQACFVSEYPYPEQVRVVQYHINDSKGAGWARNEAQTLWQGEEYVLQIQAHMRFEPNWDEAMLDMLSQCPAKKPVLSAYAPSYTPPNELSKLKNELLRMRIRKLADEIDPQIVHLSRSIVPCEDKDRGGLYPTPFWIGNFMFSKSEAYTEVPHDPHIYFWGEEIAYSARLWTHGWDIFQPDKPLLYHQWDRRDTGHKQAYRSMLTDLNQRSMARIKHLLEFEKAYDPSVLVELERYGLGHERSLHDLWEFMGINWSDRKITKEAEEGWWNILAREKGRTKAAQETLPKIFVQIASYRDPDCQHTVKDLFDKATHPERISVGICWQFVKGEDDICFQVPAPRPQQVSIHEVDAKQSKGVCWARNLTQQLWRGEAFTLQIDSHMRFEQGWDELLLSMWKDCDSEKAVLTCYPPGFTPPDDCQREWVFGMAAKEFDKDGIFLMHGRPGFSVNTLPAKPIPGAFASACMLFGPSSIIHDVPYDPYLYFFGEEIMLAVRLWTSGYDVFHPNQLVIYHDWDRGKRPTHFSDHRDWGVLNDLAQSRVLHLLGTKISQNPEVLKDIERYGLGTARTLAEYQRYSGVDFSRKTISEHALQGEYKPYMNSKNGSTQQPRIFVNIASYRDPECQWTVKDLFEKAKHPDRIFVGICWQFDQQEDQHCFKVSTCPDQVRIIPVDWRDAEGVCWARNQAQQLWDGEEYTLMIDSHMRFMADWDELLIEELAKCDAQKPVISCSPIPYTPPHELAKHTNPTIRRVRPFTPDGNIRCQGEALERSPPKPLKGAFLVANFVFSRSEVIKEVPYDPYLYFDQEEITYAARLYTHGWDIFSPTRQFMYHYYNDAKVPGGTVRPLHWHDLHKEDDRRIHFLRERGLKRFNHMTGYQISDDHEVTKELAIYGFGRERTLQQFEQFSGLDFKRKIASERALRCLFIENLHNYRRPIFIPELDDAKKKQHAEMTGQPAGMIPKIKMLPTKLLEPGDFVPMFEVMDTNKKTRAVEVYGGKYSMLFFLPAANKDYIKRFFLAIQHHVQLNNLQDVWQMFILDDTVENLIELKQKLKLSHILWADGDRRLARSFGICQPNDNSLTPVGYVVNNNLKITHCHANLDAVQLATAVANDCRKELESYKIKNQDAHIISSLPPLLIVPDVLTPELCHKCIQSFHTGHTFEGTVGAAEDKLYRPDSKVRTDHIVTGPLLAEIDEKLSRSFFPEIKKVFGFEVKYREIYKVGLYSGEKQGFFKQHRDNFDTPMGYRHIASTIHLNDAYEGGGLRFPEYDEHIYRPQAGSGIAFSCATLHEARPVTKGERFVLVGFFHGDEDEAYRRHYVMNKGGPPRKDEFTAHIRQYPEIRQSRDFVKKWREDNIRFNQDTAVATTPLGEVATTPASPLATKVNGPKPTMNIMVNSLGKHQPKKVYESKSAIIFDDFLPEDIYRRINDHALMTDYEYINTGKVTRAWHVHDGFPLRSTLNLYYYAQGTAKPEGDHVYPTKTPLDPFVDHMLAMQPNVQHMIGQQGKDWQHFSVTSWIYPHGTGLSMHDDGSGVYSGAYVYFLNPTWKPHWGGLLLMVEEDGNRLIHDHRGKTDQMDFYKRNWLHANSMDELLMEHGFAQCILPKKNRIVFIANDAYHMVTRVNEQAGDNLRMSLAGFFNRKK